MHRKYSYTKFVTTTYNNESRCKKVTYLLHPERQFTSMYNYQHKTLLIQNWNMSSAEPPSKSINPYLVLIPPVSSANK